jgi:hypothetical protein
MKRSEFISKIKDLAKTVYAEKSNPLADAEEIEDIVTRFPVIDKFPPLKKVMEDLFDFQYDPFVEDIEWVAPRPTTFRVKLVNGADFFLIYQGEEDGKGVFIAQVAGKKYFLESLPEEQQASEAIARLLRYKFADKGKEEGGDDLGDLGGDEGGDLGGDLGGEEEPTEPAVPDSVEDL